MERTDVPSETNEHESIDDALRAGVALYNDGEHHAAHDAWEDHWLELEKGSDDERFLHGLIQFTAAIYHARRGNWSGATGLAESATEYLTALPTPYRGVDVDAVRTSLRSLRSDPERIERERPPVLTVDGDVLTARDLDFDIAAVAAAVIAEEYDRYDEAVVDAGIGFAREELGGAQTRYITFVMDFAADAVHRDVVYQRLAEHVERRQQRASDVAGLFD
ncbi:hypothetical protein HSB1_15650 [Halogranum salarium B-1]|uniref:DUF309 domain-containing protein n=1 Tax=Halogranum salarium B-1 TaxID=1210908 RepID=J3EZE7_9EURY|nr:hypothetical protein HSB1_15650 [Halogranum salarium B-1]